MHSDQLKEILASHKLWLESKGTQGKRADLLGANLYRANLQRAYLQRAYLREANLSEANLYEADLREAKFTIEIREVLSFEKAQVSEMQLPWLVLHPSFGEWMKSLKINP